MIPRTAVVLLAGALLTLSGCASGDDAAGDDGSASASTSATASPTTSDTESESPTQEPTEQVVEVSVSVRDGKVRPKPRRVDVLKDSQVRLTVTSDVDDELHVHGYEIEEELEAGRATTVEFVADQDGVFEVETHETGLQLMQLEVR
jgi:hypothetical protein